MLTTADQCGQNTAIHMYIVHVHVHVLIKGNRCPRNVEYLCAQALPPAPLMGMGTITGDYM